MLGGTSPYILLKIALEKVVRDSDRERKETVCNKTIQICVYADIFSVDRTMVVLKGQL
jgi:hypothetical protein